MRVIGLLLLVVVLQLAASIPQPDNIDSSGWGTLKKKKANGVLRTQQPKALSKISSLPSVLPNIPKPVHVPISKTKAKQAFLASSNKEHIPPASESMPSSAASTVRSKDVKVRSLVRSA